MKQNISALLKPASSLCNLACRYCFYKDLADHRAEASTGVMSDAVADAVLEKTLAYADGGAVTYCFQGGEPTLAGLDFYRRFVRRAAESNPKQSPIRYSLQTNGTLLDDEWCAFLKENHFLVGLSLDGRAAQHDYWRVDAQGRGTFAAVKASLQRLQAHGVPFNVLSTVTPEVAAHIDGIWDFFTALGCESLQFTTCLEPIGQTPFTAPYALTNEQYYAFHKRLFDRYLAAWKGGHYVSVRHLDNLMAVAQGQQPEQCGMQGRCYGQLVVEGDGTVYPCDFYCADAYRLGNILELGLDALRRSAEMQRFTQSSCEIDPGCRGCEVYGLCRGGCRRERAWADDGVLRKNLYCEGRKRFYRYFVRTLQQG